MAHLRVFEMGSHLPPPELPSLSMPCHLLENSLHFMQVHFCPGHWLSLPQEVGRHRPLKAILPTGLVPVWILNRLYKYRVTTIGFKTDTQKQNTKVLSVYACSRSRSMPVSVGIVRL